MVLDYYFYTSNSPERIVGRWGVLSHIWAMDSEQQKAWHQGLDGPGLVGHRPYWGQEEVRLHARCLFILRKYVFPVKTMSNTGFSKKNNQVKQNRDWHWAAFAIPAMLELLTNAYFTPESLTPTGWFFLLSALKKCQITCKSLQKSFARKITMTTSLERLFSRVFAHVYIQRTSLSTRMNSTDCICRASLQCKCACVLSHEKL